MRLIQFPVVDLIRVKNQFVNFLKTKKMPVKINPSLRSGLLTHRLDGQLMVYDKRDDQIHLLDGTTATVFELLEKGASTHHRNEAERSASGRSGRRAPGFGARRAGASPVARRRSERAGTNHGRPSPDAAETRRCGSGAPDPCDRDAGTKPCLRAGNPSRDRRSLHHERSVRERLLREQ